MSGVPLYLHTSTAQRLDLDSAERLCIERKDLPEKRIPLRLISRIVCSSTLDISARALVACMKSGIPLALVEPNGIAIGWCMGARRTETTMRQLLTHALDDPEWDRRYTPWLHNQQLAIAAQVLVLCNVPVTAPARNNPRTALCNAHHRKHQQACGNAVDAIASQAQQALCAHLVNETGAPELLAWARPGLNLIHDLSTLLGLHAHTDIHHAPEIPPTHHAQKDLNAWAVDRYEKHTAHWQQRIAHLSWSFEQFLRSHWL